MERGEKGFMRGSVHTDVYEKKGIQCALRAKRVGFALRALSAV